MKLLNLILLFFITQTPLVAQEADRFRVEAGITFSHFQQQVKAQVGEPRGERIVYQLEIGASLTGTYRLSRSFNAGLFTRSDVGRRTGAIFDGFDSDGRTTVRNRVGGTYTEFWVGPLLQYHRGVFMAEFGYAPFGIRYDAGREDIPSETGDTDGVFSTHPVIAWLASAGIILPISSRAEFVAKVEYRPRYYNRRGGRPLRDDIDHGTQSIAPVIGIAWHF